ncbi:MAG: 2Fe-2S iron-sulfur cluster binding domain-containing protein [Candidatus Gracilibacteria bacterium]|nr:2Fe-2S iron-sulfur cluster binding domain-containing protein [Candidatus Gracilibacteria bacterium]
MSAKIPLLLILSILSIFRILSILPMAKIIYKDEDGTSTEIIVDPEKSVLEMLEEAGIDYPFSCMAGACSTCKITVHKGKEDLKDDAFGTPMYPVDDNEVLSCICGVNKAFAENPDAVIELEKTEE